MIEVKNLIGEDEQYGDSRLHATFNQIEGIWFDDENLRKREKSEHDIYKVRVKSDAYNFSGKFPTLEKALGFYHAIQQAWINNVDDGIIVVDHKDYE